MFKLIRMMGYAAVLMWAFDQAMTSDQHILALVVAGLFVLMVAVMLEGNVHQNLSQHDDYEYFDNTWGGMYPNMDPRNRPD